jgi:hypothetical protein
MSRIAYETAEFRADFRRASRQAQGKIEAFIRKFDEDASRGGLHLKSPEKAVDPRVKVARVDQGLRAVLVDLGNSDYALVRVMEHDAAYAWSVGLRPDVSSFNGLPRLLRVEAAEDIGEEARPERKDLFAHRRDRDFSTVGVPDFAVRTLRNMPDREAVAEFADLLGDSDPLLGIAIHGLVDEDRSVDDIYGELLELEGTAPVAAGVGITPSTKTAEPAPIDTDDLEAALARPGAAERFRVVDDSEELIAALEGDFADWQIFLHPLQHKAAYSTSFGGPARISGGAGTGKTVVLLHRVKALLDNATGDDVPRILLTTFTTHLKQDLRRLLSRLVGTERAADVDVVTVDELARQIHLGMTGQEPKEVLPEEERRLWDEIAARSTTQRSAVFLRNEYRHVILARGVRSLEEYLEVPRSGRGVALSPLERRHLWPLFEVFEARTRQIGRFTTLQLTEAVAALVEQLPTSTYDHVLVDEAQDLHASQWRLLRSIVPGGPDDLFIAGDAFQRIYGDTVSLRSLGIETRGRSVRLRRNYRTTHEIIEWALGLVRDDVVVDIDELGADLSGYHSVRHGPQPKFLSFPDAEAEVVGLVGLINDWRAEGHNPEAIAVAVRTKDRAAELTTALERAGVPAARLGRKGPVEGKLNVSTMHRLKGLEYPCVAVVGLDAASVPPPGAVCPRNEDPSQHKADLQTERSLVYVAATRARDQVAIMWSGEPSDLISDRVRTLAETRS